MFHCVVNRFNVSFYSLQNQSEIRISTQSLYSINNQTTSQGDDTLFHRVQQLIGEILQEIRGPIIHTAVHEVKVIPHPVSGDIYFTVGELPLHPEYVLIGHPV